VRRVAGVLAVFMVVVGLVVAVAPVARADDGPQQVITSPTGDPDFGDGLATDGDVLVVSDGGSPAHLFVYRRSGSDWVLDDTITLGVTPVGKVVVDGDWIATLAASSGDVIMYHFDGTDWIQQPSLVYAHATWEPYIGLFMDGTHLVLGLEDEAGPDRNDGGAIAPYELIAGTWTPLPWIFPKNPNNARALGMHTSLAGDRIVDFDWGKQKLYTFQFSAGDWHRIQLTDLTSEVGSSASMTRGGDWLEFYKESVDLIRVYHFDPTAGTDGEFVYSGDQGLYAAFLDEDHMIMYEGSSQSQPTSARLWERTGPASWVEVRQLVPDPSQPTARRVYWRVWTGDQVVMLQAGSTAGSTEVGVYDLTPRCFGQTPTIMGTPGDDVLPGTSGPDVIVGLAGNDTITGLGGDDLLCGGPGDDLINGGPGDDQIDGSSGLDTLTLEDAPSGEAIDFPALTAAGGDGSDSFLQIEQVVGSDYADTFLLPEWEVWVAGGKGDDTFVAVPGTHHLDGNGGTDTLDYSGVTEMDVDLPGGWAHGGYDIYQIVTETLDHIENVIGTPTKDTIIGDDADNVIDGGAGNDLIDPGGGNDTVDGGAGKDTLSYAEDDGPVSMDLTLDHVLGSEGYDVHHGFEKFQGSNGDDTILGTDGNDKIDGAGGDDLIHGGPGRDKIEGGTGADLIFGGGGGDTLRGGKGTDYLIPGKGNDKVWGLGTGGLDSQNRDTVSFEFSKHGVVVNTAAGTATGEGTDTLHELGNVVGTKHKDKLYGTYVPLWGQIFLVGWKGDDVLEGHGPYATLLPGGGDDTVKGYGDTVYVDYEDVNGGVDVNLVTGSATGAGSDTLVGIRGAIGSPGDDTLYAYGMSTYTKLVGLQGADTLTGTNYADDMWGDEGSDKMYGYAGNDYIDGGPGSDYANAGTGTDTCVSVENYISCDYRRTVDKADGVIGWEVLHSRVEAALASISRLRRLR
jgi:Ca2+-binding RTX toxin-like protein